MKLLLVAYVFFPFFFGAAMALEEKSDGPDLKRLTVEFSEVVGDKSADSVELMAYIGAVKNNEIPDVLDKLAFLAQQPGERWNYVELIADTDDRIIPLLVKLGFVHDIMPEKKRYDYILLSGCSYFSFKERIEFFIGLYKKGLRFKKLYILSGIRRLQPFEKENIPAGIDTEVEMMSHFVKMYKLDQLIGMHPEIIDSFVQPGYFRATSATNVQAWLMDEKLPGSILAISNQPEVLYQHSVLNYYIKRAPMDFSLESVGPAMKDIRISRLISAFSKWLNWSYSDWAGPKGVFTYLESQKK